MKILHTSDWHIGKVVNHFSMIEDQEYILNQFIELVDKEKPDVIIIAGDLYDRGVPPTTAVNVLNNILTKLIIGWA
ncbi:hypothetical protein AN641_03335 [Candidatus Epulonipiscioides gigas]|nr:hypothetical protein AN641_03335 [Epulopiscium sp. SCG-C07WGA-EpuloA2]